MSPAKIVHLCNQVTEVDTMDFIPTKSGIYICLLLASTAHMGSENLLMINVVDSVLSNSLKLVCNAANVLILFRHSFH